ncbi:YggS family pyridoxal phosphate-dependent enzyme [Sandaracinobacter sp. RS1-74]|uniref:YggS family pyridoxal phosphate-dependent enzyme n=1 Tax=Sandaracinobacteroides sayramensis TaxID=2913411 RepID=UPI001EDB0F4F|nr:YggS family pyridoxal phosphate-dependent enzyme [Sandaracinobacteroides sayramensis]MCG2841529.1 YggS family pyridoxal phosphate-dependent enzyme [Sandaracinobacteroides sayramensis]
MKAVYEAEVAQFRAALEAVNGRIAAACARVGRDVAGVRLLPVSKTVPVERLRAAVAAGMQRLGENKVQEALEKSEAMADLPVCWSVIGHLQTNKAKYVARFAEEFQALDSLKLAEALERRLEVEDRTLEVFVQVNTSAEASKFGLPPDEVIGFCRELAAFGRLQVQGLMTLALFSDDMARVAACFDRLAALRERLRQEGPAISDWAGLSMGMSGDFELAVERGATVVRVGQAIFGRRPTPDSDYWPELAG